MAQAKYLIIRADANAQIGTGHLMRCLALAQAWKDAGGEVAFITACRSEGLLERFREEGFEVHLLSSSYPDPGDWEVTKNVLARHPDAWVVLDGYHFDETYQQWIKDAGNCLLVMIDDMTHLKHYYADIVLNQNLYAEDSHYLFSTAYDPTAVDFLEEMGVPVHKVASFEIVDIPLIEKMAHTGKPLIISTGMATLGEIEEAVQAARRAGAVQIALLKCTSAYPAPPEEMNLQTIPHLAEAFGVPVGLSDHTLGIAVPVAAVALGACIVEKHFTLSRDIPGPDSAFSLEPHKFKAMVEAIRTAEKALGKVSYEIGERETASRVFRRSLFVVKDVKAGEVFTEENVRSIRPEYGLSPKYLKDVLGRRAARDIEKGTPLEWKLIV